MTSVILLCYWGGDICDGPEEGVSYNKPPSKAINIQRGIKFNEVISQIHVATSIVNNFNDKFRNPNLKVLSYRAGSQNQVRKFNSIMDKIRTLNPKAREWLEGHPLSKWTLAHDGGKRYRMLTINMSEIFNSVLKGARYLPITSCVQLIFYRVVHYFNVIRSLGGVAQVNGNLYTPYVSAKQSALMTKASAHTMRSFNREKGIFKVTTQTGKNAQVLNLEKQTCTCVRNMFKGTTQLQTTRLLWASEFSPFPHEAYWPKLSITLLPNSDLKRKRRGRPRSTRLQNGMDIKEGKKENKCGFCKQSGHNKKRCPSKPKKRPGDL
nr:DNA-binding WRKY [Tanacetum cinerariifolium]